MDCSLCNETIPDDIPYYVRRMPDNSLVDPPVEGVEHNGIVCQECYDEANICEGCSGTFVEDDGRTDSRGEFWCDSCYDNHFSTCIYCEREVWMDDTPYDEGYVCDSCYTEHYFSCNCCDEYTHNDAAHDTEDGLVCSCCRDTEYNICNCGDIVHTGHWCNSCDNCGRCCTCSDTSCEEVREEPIVQYDVGIRAQPFPSIGEPIRANQNCESVPEPIIPRSVGGTSTGMPALIQTLDNTAFRLCDENIEAVLGMLDKAKKITVDDITGRYCTANGSYFKLERIVAEVGKVSKPRYFYGLRSNKYDVVISHSTSGIISKLTSLGLTYHLRDGDRHKVGLSFGV